MDLSNKKLALEKVKKRFPLGSTVVDKDGDEARMDSYANIELNDEDIILTNDIDDEPSVFLYYKGNWSTVVKTAPELPSSSPLQALFKNLINS